MRRIEYTSAFRRDYKREKRGSIAATLTPLFPKLSICSQQIKLFLKKTATMSSPANGMTIANATSDRTCS